jgi:hypothetical protein
MIVVCVTRTTGKAAGMQLAATIIPNPGELLLELTGPTLESELPVIDTVVALELDRPALSLGAQDVK